MINNKSRKMTPATIPTERPMVEAKRFGMVMSVGNETLSEMLCEESESTADILGGLSR